MPVFTTRMPAGIAGTVTRANQATIEPQIMDANYPVTVYGVPVKYVSGLVRPIAASDTVATVVQGFLVRPFPTQNLAAGSEALGTATPSLVNAGDIMKRGYMMIKVNASVPSAVPAKGGVVYCRKTDHGAGEYLVGGVESDADSAKCEAIPGCYFTGAMDANGNCEIAYNI